MKLDRVSTARNLAFVLAIPLIGASFPLPAHAENLFVTDGWPALASDRSARQVGDVITVVIYEQSSAANAAQTGSRKDNAVRGAISGGSLSESGAISFGGTYTGRAETTRSGRMIAQISVVVEDTLPNGDFVIGGLQQLYINGELTDISVRGQVRMADLTSDNRVLSSRIANAQINYKGEGFVSRGAKPGLITRIFSFLGLV